MPGQQEWEALEFVGQIVAGAEADPAYPVLAEWYQARRAEFEAIERHQELEANPEGNGIKNPDFYASYVMCPAMDRCNSAFAVLSRVVPTTPAGLYAQLAVAFNMEWSGPCNNEASVIVLQSAAEAAKRLIAASGAAIN